MNYWPRWIRAIRSKTMHLSLAQMGAYDRLLDYYYEEEKPLPPSVDACCRICGALTKQDRADVASVLAEFFTLTDRGYAQERTEEEIALAKPKIEAARTNGMRGGRPRGSSKNPSGFPAGTEGQPAAKAPHPQTSSSPSGQKNKAPLCVALDVLVAAGFDEQTADEFISHKARMMAPLTERAWSDHLAEAKKAGWSPIDAAKKVMARNWKGFEARYVECPGVASTAGKHAGFDTKDYSQGVTADGRIT